MKFNWTLALCAAVGLIITGCAGPQPPAKWFVRRGPTYNQSMPAVDRIGVLVDAAVVYDRVGTNYITLEDSHAAITNMLREAEAALRTRRYEIAFLESPFIGAFKPAGTTFAVAEKRKDSPLVRAAPFHTANEFSLEPQYRDALIRISRDALDATSGRGELPTDQLRSDDGTRAALKSIAARRNIRYLFVIQGNGAVVSGGKQLGQGIGTALLSSAISLGNTIVVAHNTSMLSSFASLIDLEQAEVLWCNALSFPGLNPVAPDDYKGRWQYHLLYWLPPKGQLEPPPLK